MKDSSLVRAAQAAGPQGKTAPAGGGKTPMPRGDGLDKAWANQTARPSTRVDLKAARVKVR
jgi:hypothetical protein